MKHFRHRPIKEQFTLVNLITAAVALGLVSSVLFAVQVIRLKTGFERQLSAMVDIVAHGSESALRRADKELAMQSLEGFAAIPEITGATLYLENDTILAGFHPGGKESTPNVFLKHNFIINGSHGGRLEVSADNRRTVWDLVRVYSTIGVCTLMAALLVAFLLSRLLEDMVAGPVLSLAAVARQIESDRDYAVRASTSGSEEVKVLTDAFNQMLEQIEAKDDELKAAHDDLERQLKRLEMEIEQRKRIQVEQTRLAAIIEATPDFIGSCDRKGSVFYLNKAARNALGDIDHPLEDPIPVNDWRRLLGLPVISSVPIKTAMKKGSWIGETRIQRPDGTAIQASQVIIAHKDSDGELEYFSTILRDITPILVAEEALRESQQRLVESSRRAGMADIATAVLHNVGNVLNSVNVSAGLVKDLLHRSRIQNVTKTATLMLEQEEGLPDFLTTNERGRRIPAYLAHLGGHLAEERATIIGEVDQLARNIEHIKEVVAMQQSYAKVSGALESLNPKALIDEALAMHAAALRQHRIDVELTDSSGTDVYVDRHKTLQVLINLISNAIQALEATKDGSPRRLTVKLSPADACQVAIIVGDNGVGIATAHLDRIFAHGFTTRPSGHGFGLHSAALAARQMGGALSVQSQGIGFGAEFTLTLPVAPLALSP